MFAQHSTLFLIRLAPPYTFCLTPSQGGELFDRIVSRGSFTEAEAATVASGMLKALAHLHSHNVMHRDGAL